LENWFQSLLFQMLGQLLYRYGLANQPQPPQPLSPPTPNRAPVPRHALNNNNNNSNSSSSRYGAVVGLLHSADP
jgi:hypothetical protein